jgi:flavodoxin
MHAVVVVESIFGNTRSLADAVARGLGDAVVIDAAHAPEVLPADVGLVVIGGPTHVFGMSRANTRTDAVRQGGADVQVGIRDFLERFGAHQEIQLAVFDTRVEKGKRLPGSAARGAAKALHRLGYDLVADPESFYVLGTAGPLVEGEHERARRWGERLANTRVGQGT